MKKNICHTWIVSFMDVCTVEHPSAVICVAVLILAPTLLIRICGAHSTLHKK